MHSLLGVISVGPSLWKGPLSELTAAGHTFEEVLTLETTPARDW